MISNLSSLIEFMSAIYVSMSLDNEICTRFWAPDYLSVVKSELSKYEFHNQKSFFDGFIKDISTVHDNTVIYSRRRGAFSLLVCITFLIICGFETELKALNNGYLAICGVSFVACITSSFVFRKIFIKTKYVIFAYLSLVAIFLIVVHCLPKSSYWGLNDEEVSTYGRLIIATTVLLPIICQLMENWLFSRIYHGYLSDKVKKENDKYEKSVRGIADRNKEEVDKAYMKAWMDSVWKNKDGDTSHADLNKVLFERLMKITRPNQVTLLISLFWHKIKQLYKKLKKLFNQQDQTEPPVKKYESIKDYIKEEPDYSQQYAEYRNLQKSRKQRYSARDYCIEHGIDHKKFVSWMHLHTEKQKP